MGGHLAGRREVTAVKSAATVVLQRGPFGRAQARIGKKVVGALLMGLPHQSAVELLRHIDGRFTLSGMQNGKRVVAQGPVRWPGRDHRRTACCKKMAAR